MHIDLHHIAALARIGLTDEEAAELGPQLDRILAYIDTLQRVDTSGVAPTAHPHDSALILRPDVVTNTNRRDELLACAPETDGGLFVVPKVIE
ncbi:MAG: Asp-tRNA(Asn)/Glu-tRNA(Gln) amidotransferase subunit GatC [Zetaproteobacteria bacterium]|nr:MAG: Asp-tRNA(Asn)/Glu-tRNA(Gln) amidotransferase subunit GatC [Zetaproteobacteria bacterium]